MLVKPAGIFFYSIDANIDFAYDVSTFGQIEGHDIGVIIVTQVLAVYLQQFPVGAKNVIQFIKPFSFISE